MRFGLIVSTALAAAAMFIGPANANVIVTGSGTWGGTVPMTTASAPNSSWSFSFELPNPIGGSSTSDITNAEYLLGGSPISADISNVTFYSTAFSGLFDLTFSDGTVVSLYGDDIGSSGTIQTGTFSADIGLNGDLSVSGTGSVTVSDASAVPEPATIALLGAGLLGVGRTRRRKQAA